jgi:DNA segregation ATPase FtsK/SpoIIIE, S-DNA-T family
VALMAAGAVAFYCVLFPAGEWGRHVKGGLAWAFGSLRALVPLWAVYAGFRLAVSKSWPQFALRLALWSSFFLFSDALLSLFGRAAFGRNYGGALGLSGAEFLARLLGTPGAWIVSLAALALTLCGLFRVAPAAVLQAAAARLKADWEEWRQARGRAAEKKPPVVKPRPLAAASRVLEPVVPQISMPPALRPAHVKGEPAKNGDALPDAPPPARPAPARAAAPSAPAASSESPAESVPAEPYRLPPLSLLKEPSSQGRGQSQQDLIAKARLLEQTLGNFGVSARVTDIHPGPVITRYDLEPAPGVKISSIVALSDDIALAMRATRVRVLAPIPGKGAVGVEIPNSDSATVVLKEILSHPSFQNARSPLTFALGKTSSGEPSVADLAAMPHLLVAGATGAGKSVCIHALITSILMHAEPDRVKFMLIDPKRLELPGYDGIPHMYDPRTGPDGAQVITQPKEAAKALARLVKVMEFRYELFAKSNVRNIEGYNEKRVANGLPPEYYIVVIIDELADLMLVATREVEDSIQRLAQMARAVGIHLVLATQRPSVDVITGVIKANLPARIALRVASQIDSRVILDTVGAEALVGKGDMLFLPAGAPEPIRLQGAFVSEAEVSAVAEFAKQQAKPRYEDIFAKIAAAQAAHEDAETKGELDQALRLILERKRVSQDLLKAHFGSSARATNVLSLLEVRGFIHKPDGTNRWEIYFDKIDDYMRIG